MEEEWPQDLSDEKFLPSKPSNPVLPGEDEDLIYEDDSYDSWVAALNAPANNTPPKPENSKNGQSTEKTDSSLASIDSSEANAVPSSPDRKAHQIKSSDAATPQNEAVVQFPPELVADGHEDLQSGPSSVLVNASDETPSTFNSVFLEDEGSIVKDTMPSSNATGISSLKIEATKERSSAASLAPNNVPAIHDREALPDVTREEQESEAWGNTDIDSIEPPMGNHEEESTPLSLQNTAAEPLDVQQEAFLLGDTKLEHDTPGIESHDQEEQVTSWSDTPLEHVVHHTEAHSDGVLSEDVTEDAEASIAASVHSDPSKEQNVWIQSENDWDTALNLTNTVNIVSAHETNIVPDEPTFKWQLQDVKQVDELQEDDLPWTAEIQQPNDADFPPALVGDSVNDADATNNLEDVWAKALGSPNKDLDDSWGAAFGEDFGDDGFLEDLPTENNDHDPDRSLLLEDRSPMNTYAPPVEAIPTKQRQFSGSYATPVANIPTQPKISAPPTDFFAELPTTQPLRPRRSKMQVIPQPQSPPRMSILPDQKRSVPPPPTRQISTSQLRGPERLDLFPPQPSVPPRSTSQDFTQQFSSQPQPKPPSAPAPNTRYSPAPMQMTGSAPITSRSTSYNSQYSAPLQQPPASLQSYAPNRPSIPGPAMSSSNSTTTGLSAQENQFYSPSPPGILGRTPPTSRYSPAQTITQPPPLNQEVFSHGSSLASRVNQGQSNPAPPPPRPFGPHVPRTSSPLTHSQQSLDYSPTTSPRRKFSAGHEVDRSTSHPFSGDGLNSTHIPPKRGSIPSTLQDIPELPVSEQPRTVSYQPQTEPYLEDAERPRRPRTQSPGTSNDLATSMTPLARPSSVQPPTSSLQNSRSQNLHFLIPEDERATDLLQRWKGSPIFRWGPGGHVLSTFPKQIPRYGVNQSQPMLKCMPGEVNLRKLTEILPIEETLMSFPGPLKSKGKKKEVLTWLSSHVDVLEKQAESGQQTHSMLQTDFATLEDRIILWKLVRLLVEYDGILSGNPSVEKAVRAVISPQSKSDIGELGRGWASNSGPSAASMSAAQADAVSPQVMEELRDCLTNGNREKAVWHAVDNRLWGHAMLISSTVSTDLWKRVSQEFVRKEVQSSQSGNKSLATLYEIFAGNREDCVDQLIPPSARAGFQMVSAAQGSGKSVDATSALDQWRNTLGLILSNRSIEDEKAIASLGKLLSSYGRTEAAHICFLFARSASHFGGADDPQASFTLVGADHSRQSVEAIKDLDAILLSEVYEFALSLSPSATYPNIPHLQAYKLSHAFALVEYGQRNDALQYCDALANAMKSTTRPSQYYHVTLINQVEDLSKRLSQSPKDGQSSWMSKTFSEKARGSLLAKFNSFIDPRDSETSTGNGDSAGNEFGPFARIGPGTPTISRSPSTADLYHQPASGLLTQTAISAANSRYAPAHYAPRPSQEFDRHNSSPYGSYSPSSSYVPDGQNSQPRNSPYEPYGGRQMNGGGTTSAASQGLLRPDPLQNQPFPLSSDTDQASSSYEPYIPTAPEEPSGQPHAPTTQSVLMESDHDAPFNKSENDSFGLAFNGHTPDSQSYGSLTNNNILSKSDNESTSNSYQPFSGGYEPPSYQPYQPESQADDDDDDSPNERRKKTSILDDDDDDDDLAKRSEDFKKKERARKDKEADDAVRRAAEADAKRDLNKKPSGWLGGWFGKKDSNAPAVHKVKLGEENSFYYDPETKKWVNKKVELTGSSPAAPTPPPPKSRVPPASGPLTGSPNSGPPSRPPTSGGSSQIPNNTSHAVGTHQQTGDNSSSGPNSRAGTPLSQSSAGGGDALGPPLDISVSGNGPSPMPISRPSTGMSNASSIDDLLGAPAPRKGGTVKSKKRGGRYVDVMANKT